MNIAERRQSYYEHEDFIDNYAYLLLEDGSHCIDMIQKELSKWFYFNDLTFQSMLKIEREDAERILDYLRENYTDFLETFTNYYVGDYCIDSFSFGEQEEQLEGIYNHKTGKPYTLPYLRRVFRDSDYHVSNNYAYFDLTSEGVMIKLKPKKLPFYNELLKKYCHA